MKVDILEHAYHSDSAITGCGAFHTYRLRLSPSVSLPEGETVIATIGYDGDGELLDASTCRILNPERLEAGYPNDQIGAALLEAIERGIADYAEERARAEADEARAEKLELEAQEIRRNLANRRPS